MDYINILPFYKKVYFVVFSINFNIVNLIDFDVSEERHRKLCNGKKKKRNIEGFAAKLQANLSLLPSKLFFCFEDDPSEYIIFNSNINCRRKIIKF